MTVLLLLIMSVTDQGLLRHCPDRVVFCVCNEQRCFTLSALFEGILLRAALQCENRLFSNKGQSG
tara:strand:- start:1052 stop:1246 length:195 start_codon:yes stop_codon:yes gene_type:complete